MLTKVAENYYIFPFYMNFYRIDILKGTTLFDNTKEKQQKTCLRFNFQTDVIFKILIQLKNNMRTNIKDTIIFYNIFCINISKKSTESVIWSHSRFSKWRHFGFMALPI